MSGLSTILKGAIYSVGLVIILGGCSNVATIRNYELPNKNRAVEGTVPVRKPFKKMLKNTLDDVMASNVFDSEYENEFKGRRFKLEWRKPEDKGCDGRYRGSEDIVIFIDENDLLEENYDLFQHKAARVIIHEEAHRYWDKHFSDEKREEFRDQIFNMHAKYLALREELKELQEQGSDSLYTEFHSLLEEYDFTKSTLAVFEDFLESEDYYREFFGEHFVNGFYGTEAYAQMFEKQAQYIFENVYTIAINRGEKDFMSIIESKIAENELTKTDLMLKELLPFYENLLNERYFIQ